MKEGVRLHDFSARPTPVTGMTLKTHGHPLKAQESSYAYHDNSFVCFTIPSSSIESF